MQNYAMPSRKVLSPSEFLKLNLSTLSEQDECFRMTFTVSNTMSRKYYVSNEQIGSVTIDAVVCEVALVSMSNCQHRRHRRRPNDDCDWPSSVYQYPSPLVLLRTCAP